MIKMKTINLNKENTMEKLNDSERTKCEVWTRVMGLAW